MKPRNSATSSCITMCMCNNKPVL